jgi:hypothetical protein
MYRIALLLIVALIFASCSSAPETETTATDPLDTSTDIAPPPSTTSDALSGTWTGDWGPSERDRNDVRLELQYDGTTLMGTINPGDGAVPLTTASYDPATMRIMMEAHAAGRGGKVHYMIEGTVQGNSMTGTWSHETRKGDFKLTRS